MEKEIRLLDIAICPASEASKKAIATSSLMKQKGGLFALSEKVFCPHISVYMIKTALANIPKIIKLAERISKEVKPFFISSKKFRQSVDGYADVAFSKPNGIVDLQRKIIKNLLAFSFGPVRGITEDEIKTGKFNARQLKNFRIYGYDGVGAEFIPHLTFTKFPEFNKDFLKGIAEEDFSFKAGEIGVFLLGDYGVCKKKLKSFHLGK